MKYLLPVTHVTRCASLSCEINKANSLGVFPGISLKNRHIYFHSIFPYNMEHVAQLLRKYREYQFKICQLTHSINPSHFRKRFCTIIPLSKLYLCMIRSAENGYCAY